MQINFKVLPDQGPWSGFELGDVYLADQGIEMTSALHTPSQSMMIFVALADLLGGFEQLKGQKNGGFEFGGPGSSFVLHFRKRSDRLEIIGREAEIQIPFSVFYKILFDAGRECYREHLDLVGRYAAVMTDLSPFFED